MREWWGDCGQFYYAVFKARGCSQIVSRKFFFKKSEAGRKKRTSFSRTVSNQLHKLFTKHTTPHFPNHSMKSWDSLHRPTQFDAEVIFFGPSPDFGLARPGSGPAGSSPEGGGGTC